MRYHQGLVDAEKGFIETGIDPVFEDWTPPPDPVVDLFMWYEGDGRQHLPGAGGLMDQDEGLMHYFGILAEINALIRAEVRNHA